MTTDALPRIAVVCGPTACGKTDLGIRLAEAVNGEVVGADSLQIYRHFDLGSAKPTAAEMARVRHHLVSVWDPQLPFNAAMYKGLADAAIADIRARGRVPVIVGGTGLYLRILVRGIFEAPKPDLELRERLKGEMAAYGVEQLYNRLTLIDPMLAAKVEPHDRNRIMRGLEIFEQTGIALSEHQRVHDFGESSYEAFSVGIHLERGELYARIEARTRRMIEQGLLEEYRDLRQRGYAPDLKPMLSLGYRQMGLVEAGELTLEQAAAAINRETKRYAKRQLTWFRKDLEVHWYEPSDATFPSLAADVRRFMAGEPLRSDWVATPP